MQIELGQHGELVTIPEPKPTPPKMRDVLNGIGEVMLDLVFGKEIEGIVEAVKEDDNQGGYYHILVRTTQGTKRHFTFDKTSYIYRFGKGVERVGMPFSRGDSFALRASRTNLIQLPWSRVERDPFNLRAADAL